MDYADSYTRDRISVEKEHTIALIKPSVMDKLGEILNVIHRNGLSILKMRMCVLTKVQALQIYENKKGDKRLAEIVEHLASGPSVAIELIGRDAINKWRKLMGT